MGVVRILALIGGFAILAGTASSVLRTFVVPRAVLSKVSDLVLDATVWVSRMVADKFAVTGMVIVALQIAYLPTLYAAYNRRESLITVLSARGGEPAWGPEILARPVNRQPTTDLSVGGELAEESQ